MIFTGLATYHMKADLHEDAAREFAFACDQIKITIHDRLKAHEQVLRSGAALFDSSDHVTREEWRTFTGSLRIEQQLPGILGIGFSPRIPREALEQHLREIRGQGFPDYQVTPEGERETYSAIIYLEPFTGRNLRAFGYDMLSEPVRRAAMERARDQDEAALTGRVVLVQETDRDVQAGTLMYVPVYHKGMPTNTVEQRRAALQGWVYSPYRMNDLMQGTLGGWDAHQRKRVRLRIFDGDSLSPESLLYDSNPGLGQGRRDASRLVVQAPIVFAGRQWTLYFSQSGDSPLATGQAQVLLVLAGGTTVSLLLFWLALSLSNTRHRAQRIAEQLTAELSESEEKFRLLLESAGEGIYGIDINGLCYFCNPACLRMLGYDDPGEVLGRNMHVLIHHSRADGVGLAIEECRIYKALHKGQGTQADDEVFWRRDGSSFPVEYSSYPQRRGDEIVGAVVSFLDITRRKQAEEAIRVLAKFPDENPNPVLRVSARGVITYANQAARHSLGAPNCRVGQPAPAFLAPGIGNQRGAFAANREFEVEVFGRVFQFSSAPISESGDIYFYGRDTTDRRQLEQQRQMTATVFENSIEGIVIADPQGKVQLVNPAYSAITGFSAAETIGEDLHVFRAKEDSPVFFRQLWEALATHGRWSGEYWNRRRGGEVYPEWLSVVLVKDAQGDILNYVMISHDITEQKRFQKELQEAKEAAERANQAKSDFLASMSHEIRTPMNAIIGMAELLGDTPLDPVQRKYVGTFRAAGENLLGIINDILDLSKIEAGYMLLERQPFDLRELVSRVCDLLTPRAQVKGLELCCRVSPELPSVLKGDAGRLHQVLVNLTGNAVKFTEAGEVNLVVEPAAASVAENQAPLHFMVQDTGIGIAADKLDSVFENFIQADASVTRKHGGTGLGLAISKHLVELMGGRMWVESRQGLGSTFHFEITLELPDLGEAIEEPASSKEIAGLIVLVVDDSAIHRQIIKENLNKWGAVVETADSGQAGIAAMRQALAQGRPYGLMVLDQLMPDLKGGQVARVLHEEGMRTPILLLSSDRGGIEVEQAKRLGITAQLLKPVKSGDLKEAVLKALGRGSAAAAPPSGQPPWPQDEQELGLSILVVEDNEDNRLLVEQYLKKTPHRLSHAGDGQAAVEMFQREGFDLVLMDIQMPIMDGYTATRTIRQWERQQGRPPTPIIALTAFALEEERRKSEQAGFSDHLAKPIKRKDLLEAIRRNAAAHGSRDDPKEREA